MASQENLDTSFDKSFMLLCHHPHQAVSHGNLLDMHRVSKSFNHINIPPSPHFEKFENVPKYASNDNEFIKNNVLPLPGRSHFERKSLMAKTMVSTGEKDKIKVMEANNFVKETNNFDKDAKEAKNVKIINLKEDANDSRRDSAQIISANYRKSHFNKEEVNVFKVSEEIKKSRRMLRLERFLDSVLFQVLITTFIMYALFGSDFKFYFFSKSQDFVFDILTFLSLGIFSLEIILSMITKKDYLFSFFFWLDIMSTMTLILDLSWVNEAIFGGNTSQFSKGKQSTKIGSRAGRIIRIVRLFRLIRIIKIWKSFKTRLTVIERFVRQNSHSKSQPTDTILLSTVHIPQQPSNGQVNISRVVPLKKSISPNKGSPVKGSVCSPNSPYSGMSNFSNISIRMPDYEKKVAANEESLKNIRVGRKLSEQTTKRVSILALVLIFVVPLFDSGYYYDKDRAYTIELKVITKLSEDTPINYTLIGAFCDDYILNFRNGDLPLSFLSVPSMNLTFQQSPGPDDLRFEEKDITILNSDSYDPDFIAILNIKLRSQQNSLLNILRTIAISIFLGFGAYFFTKDANELALKPIARMIEKVNNIASNPLATKDQTIVQGNMETVAIENAIIKIGTLLALGFGDAGSEIIAQNVSQGGDVDPMLPGVKQYGIFGFCDIRNFTDSTEVLQEDVMMFVNKIAYIVHKTVDKFMGAANKNIGDAFLLLWKFDKEDIQILPEQEFSIKRNTQTKNLSDFALISFLKIICSINSREEILKYRDIKALNARIPGYKVKMGFGLHVGWAIEGAIGSEYKIDASYLSPNVNIASRLEAATKQYGVHLLVSHELYERFSKRVQRFCRQVDRVTVKGSKKPLGLYTVDMDLSVLTVRPVKGYSKDEMKLKHKMRKNDVIESFFAGESQGKKLMKASLFFEFDLNLQKITRKSFGAGRNLFSEAFNYYINGKWELSRDALEKHEKANPQDGPTITLLNFIKSHNYQAPADWLGYRELVDK